MNDVWYIQAGKELTALDHDCYYCIYSVNGIRRTFWKMQMAVFM